MRAGEFDVIGCIVETDERREYFDFSPVFATIEVPIFFRRDISGITGLASLKGFPVGVKIGDQHIDILKAAVSAVPGRQHRRRLSAPRFKNRSPSIPC